MSKDLKEVKGWTMQTYSIRAFQAEKIVVAKAYARRAFLWFGGVGGNESRDEREEGRTASLLPCRPF